MSWFKEAIDKYYIEVDDFKSRNEVNHIIDLLSKYKRELIQASREVYYNISDAYNLLKRMSEDSYIKALEEIRAMIYYTLKVAYDNPWSFSLHCILISDEITKTIIDLKEKRSNFNKEPNNKNKKDIRGIPE